MEKLPYGKIGKIIVVMFVCVFIVAMFQELLDKDALTVEVQNTNPYKITVVVRALDKRKHTIGRGEGVIEPNSHGIISTNTHTDRILKQYDGAFWVYAALVEDIPSGIDYVEGYGPYNIISETLYDLNSYFMGGNSLLVTVSGTSIEFIY